MSQFENVTLVKEVNSYFDGQVTSRSLTLADGSACSLGVMLPGEYEFATADAEIMKIQSGKLHVLLPNADTWLEIDGAQDFDVPANSSFKVKVEKITDYCCLYIK